MYEIIRRYTKAVLYRSESATSARGAVIAAVESGANLGDADLGEIRADIHAVLSSAPKEVPELLTALRAGKVDGSSYSGECACLVGTIANARGCEYSAIPELKPDPNRPAERWFLAINEGDTPETNQVSRITVGWVEEWLAAQSTEASVAP